VYSSVGEVISGWYRMKRSGEGQVGMGDGLEPATERTPGCDAAREARDPCAYRAPLGVPTGHVYSTITALHRHDFAKDLLSLYRRIADA
jgi:hypothetical protein